MSKKRKSSICTLRNSKSVNSFLIALLPLIFVGISCSKFIFPGEFNLFEGDNAKRAVAKIKAKIGAEKVNVIRAEVRKHEIKIEIQAPGNPKNIDEYKFENGSVSGPKPVEVLTIGNVELTADKQHTTDLDEIDFAAIPETIKQAIALANTEGAEVKLISMDQKDAEMTNPQLKERNKNESEELEKQIKEKGNECFTSQKFPEKCFSELLELQKRQRDLSFTFGNAKELDLAWRIFVQGTRAQKDFWSDKKGKIIENPHVR